MSTDVTRSCCGAAAPSRRVVVAGGGAAVASLLAACSSGAAADGAGDPTSDPTSDPAQDPSAGGDRAVVATLADVPVGGAVILLDPAVVLTQPEEGTVEAYDAACPHAGCAVASVSDGEIVCPCHGSRFSVADGSVVNGPARKGLTSTPVTVEGDDIVLG